MEYAVTAVVGTNADLFPSILRLYVPEGSLVADVTWGRGIFWKKVDQSKYTVLSSDIQHVKGIRADFCALPYSNDLLDAVILDPPYMYCCSDDTEILTRRGWLNHEFVRAGEDVALSLNMSTGEAEWKLVESVNVFPAPLKMMSIEGSNISALVTEDHPWPVVTRTGGANRPEVLQWKRSNEFTWEDYIIQAEVGGASIDPTYSDAFVQLVAWFYTEGNLVCQRDGTLGRYGHICQSHKVNNGYVKQIRSLFRKEFGEPSDSFDRLGRKRPEVPQWRESVDGNNVRFWFNVVIGDKFWDAAPNKVPSVEFLLSLDQRQLEAFLDTSVDGDGHRSKTHTVFGQKNRQRAEAFQTAALLAGRGARLRQDSSGFWCVTLRRRRRTKPMRNKISVVDGTSNVWCPAMRDNHNWMARRNGTCYFTGNTGGWKTLRGYFHETTHDWSNSSYGNKERSSKGISGVDAVDGMYRDGMAEAYRVLKHKGILIIKCMDQVQSGRQQWAHLIYHQMAEKLGFRAEDLFVLVRKSRPLMRHKPENQKHARRNHSYFQIFRAWKR